MKLSRLLLVALSICGSLCIPLGAAPFKRMSCIEEVAPKYIRLMYPGMDKVRWNYSFDWISHVWHVVGEKQAYPGGIPGNVFRLDSVPCFKSQNELNYYPEGACGSGLPRTGTQVFDSMFSIGSSGEFLFNGSTTDAFEKNSAFKKALNEHMDWSNEERGRQLASSGAQFPPAKRKELLASARMRGLRQLIGNYQVRSCEFMWYFPSDSANPSKSFVTVWHVKLRAPQMDHKDYEVGIEPFNGEITLLGYEPHKIPTKSGGYIVKEGF